MWEERYVEICRRHPDLVAVYESRYGRLGLLLRQTLAPLGVERVDWLTETRAVARLLIADLRAAGFTGGTLVLQWLPTEEVARIVTRWIRRWDGDPARRSYLLAIVERRLADERFLAGLAAPPGLAPDGGEAAPDREGTLDEAGLDALKAWYEAMAPCWLAIQPPRRRRLVLQTHVWLAAGALDDPVAGPEQALKDLGHDGPLARALRRMVPRVEGEVWRRWIERVRRDLAQALAQPPALRTQAWAQWLFLIPYGVPVPRQPRLPTLSAGAAPATRPA